MSKRDITSFFKPSKKPKLDTEQELETAGVKMTVGIGERAEVGIGIGTEASPNDAASGGAYFSIIPTERTLQFIPEIPDSWKHIVGAETSKPYFLALEAFLSREEGQGKRIFPPRHDIFAALNLCAVHDIKVGRVLFI